MSVKDGKKRPWENFSPECGLQKRSGFFAYVAAKGFLAWVNSNKFISDHIDNKIIDIDMNWKEEEGHYVKDFDKFVGHQVCVDTAFSKWLQNNLICVWFNVNLFLF